ncbi:MAG: tRNA (N(6)-L-threonylcarbamoyladenosine(37)-C(2))-methylthiotransferase MtaB [Sphingomonadales bacterium]|nr:tRNA (N(6)-L-threonylcarbamoyladenosine(37)-C(2))-methylthiotransferase MtaB [Sphingomonadales bacterium]
MSAEVISLGCRLNLAESAELRGMLAHETDLVVINSCAVTSEAVRQTRQAIRRARREHPAARLLVTGCAAEIDRGTLAAMPEVDGLVSNKAKLDPRAWNVAAITTDVRQHTRAFVAVQNGCDHACTFCVIPQGRGSSRSTPLPAVIAEVERHLEHGAREIVLTGVDLTSWGHDLSDSLRLGQLVEALLRAFPAMPRLRLSSVDGIEIDPVLLSLIVSDRRLMPHLHLSVQHSDDLILKRMKRRHNRAQIEQLVTALRARRPDIAIGADLIAGFPTETEAAHQANLAIIETLGVVHGHIFPYSPRPGTPAARMPQVPPAIIKARAAELRTAVARVRATWLTSLLGTPLEVLAERDGTGHAPNFARVQVPPGSKAGTMVTVTPTRIVEGTLV